MLNNFWQVPQDLIYLNRRIEFFTTILPMRVKIFKINFINLFLNTFSKLIVFVNFIELKNF